MNGKSAFSSGQATGNQTPAGLSPEFPSPGPPHELAALPGESIGGVEKLRLFTKYEDFIDYFEPIVERFPSYEKNVLCARIKNIMYGIYEKIIRTNSSKNKLSGWYEIDLELKVLKRYITRTRKKGSKYLSKRSHETAVKKLLEVGKLLGGLIKRG